MDKIKKNFGFGCMRFPMIGEEIDEAQVSQMVDYFLDQGFNYFDTAHGYIGERSELAVKYGKDDRLAKKIVVFSTVVSLITLPVWCYILTV